MSNDSGMELDTFVSEALKMVVSGVGEAQKFAKEHQAHINPPGIIDGGRGDKSNALTIDSGRVGTSTSPRNSVGQYFEFDIAVTTAEREGTEGGFGLVVAALGVGGKLTDEYENVRVSRIRFKVPVFLPTQ